MCVRVCLSVFVNNAVNQKIKRFAHLFCQRVGHKIVPCKYMNVLCSLINLYCSFYFLVNNIN